MQKGLAACMAACLLAGTTAIAAAEEKDSLDTALEQLGTFSASVALTTDYRFRGISQTDREPAIQGSFDWTKDFEISGFTISPYASVWASNVNFKDGDEAQIEIDYTAGLTTEIHGITFDAFAIYYTYPGARSSLNYNFVEAGFGAGYDFGFAAVGGKFHWSPNFFGDIGDAYYLVGDVTVPLPYKFEIGGSVGGNWFDDSDTKNYADWSIFVSRPLLGFDLSLAYVDTSLSKSDCGGTKNCSATAVFTVSKTF